MDAYTIYVAGKKYGKRIFSKAQDLSYNRNDYNVDAKAELEVLLKAAEFLGMRSKDCLGNGIGESRHKEIKFSYNLFLLTLLQLVQKYGFLLDSDHL